MSKDVTAEIGFSFEAVLEAVQDSSRGRWFLEEYKRRESQADTGRLMEAVGRIETRIEGMAGHLTAAEDLSKVRQAIAKTRSDIVNLQTESKGLSEEGRLFAHLAELARKAMPEQSKQTGIEQALRLVDQIDTSLSGNVMAFPKTGDRFFQQDAAVFDRQQATPVAPMQIAAIIEKPSPPKPAAEPVPTGAKLTIRRVGPQPVADQPPAPAPPKEEPKAEPKAEFNETAKPRIVIIRRKPEELADVPLASSAA